MTNTSMERCGACGAAATRDDELCPACGALLDAYRTPSQADPLTIASPPAATVAPEATPIAPAPHPVEVAAVRDARQALVDVLSAPRRQLVDAVELIEVTQRAKRPPAPPPAAPPPAQRREVTARPAPSRAPRATQPAAAPAPKRPGYVVRGTVEPALVIGVGMLLFGCVFGSVTSMVGGGPLAALSFVVAAIGLFLAAGSVLTMLVRRDNERR